MTEQVGHERRVMVPLCYPRDPKTSLDNAWRRQGGCAEDWGPLKRESRIEEKKNKDGFRGMSPLTVLRKSPIILVTQGQEVKPRIIIMKTICLHHLMLPEIFRSKSKVENPSGRTADWN